MRRSLIVISCLGVALVSAGELRAQESDFRFGAQLSWGDDADLGLGARMAYTIPRSDLAIIGTFDYFFPGDIGGADVDYWEINGNLAYRFRVQDAPGISPYVGAGLNLATASVSTDAGTSNSNTDLGLNLLAGTGFGSGRVTPFVELRVEIEGGDQFVIAGGLLF